MNNQTLETLKEYIGSAVHFVTLRVREASRSEREALRSNISL